MTDHRSSLEEAHRALGRASGCAARIGVAPKDRTPSTSGGIRTGRTGALLRCSA